MSVAQSRCTQGRGLFESVLSYPTPASSVTVCLHSRESLPRMLSHLAHAHIHMVTIRLIYEYSRSKFHIYTAQDAYHHRQHSSATEQNPTTVRRATVFHPVDRLCSVEIPPFFAAYRSRQALRRAQPFLLERVDVLRCRSIRLKNARCSANIPHTLPPPCPLYFSLPPSTTDLPPSPALSSPKGLPATMTGVVLCTDNVCTPGRVVTTPFQFCGEKKQKKSPPRTNLLITPKLPSATHFPSHNGTD